MGYATVDEFGVKDCGCTYLTLKLEDDYIIDHVATCDFDKDQIDSIIELLKEERQRKWGKE